jgi:hypothetical protein
MEGREYNLMLKCTDDAMLLTFTTLVENFGCGNFLGQLNEFTSSPFVPRDLSFLLGLWILKNPQLVMILLITQIRKTSHNKLLAPCEMCEQHR